MVLEEAWILSSADASLLLEGGGGLVSFCLGERAWRGREGKKKEDVQVLF